MDFLSSRFLLWLILFILSGVAFIGLGVNNMRRVMNFDEPLWQLMSCTMIACFSAAVFFFLTILAFIWQLKS